MSEQDTTTEPPADDTQAEPPIEGEEHLGDPGKKALDAMKQRAKAAEASAREARTELEQLRSQLAEATAKGEAVDVDKAVAEKAAAIEANYQRKVAVAEIRAAAVGKVVDPELVPSLPGFEPDKFLTDSGEVDQEAIAKAIDELVTSKPYLAPQREQGKGSGDGGFRGGVRQLTEADLARMSPEEIVEARRKGELDALLTG